MFAVLFVITHRPKHNVSMRRPVMRKLPSIYAIFIVIIVSGLSLYPQVYQYVQRGEQYNGASFFYDYDEVVYASHVQSIIDGKPRNNSVYLGENAPQQFETIFSIQFLPVYFTALPARVFGVSSDTAFLFLSVICAVASSWLLFWVFEAVFDDDKYSSIAALFVLIAGPLVAGISFLKGILGFGGSAFYLTFLRRTTPALAFPFLILFLGLVWRGLRTHDKLESLRYGVLAGLCFAVTVFSYFFFWTAILAWILAVVILSFALDRDRLKRQFIYFWIPFGIIAVSFLGIYTRFIFSRHESSDSAQVLESTRQLVLLRPSLLIGLGVLVFAVGLMKAGILEVKNQMTVFIISFSILPVFVFNQQIVTGYSLQPMHYNMYVVNYLVAAAVGMVVFTCVKFVRFRVSKVTWLITVFGLGVWGVAEVHYAATMRYPYNLVRDEAVSVNKRLAELAKPNENRITYNFDPIQADNQPTLAPFGLIWAEHMFFLSNMSADEHRERYYFFLYFQNRSVDWLQLELARCPNQTCRALIGWKVNKTLSINPKEVDRGELREFGIEYGRFLERIDYQQVKKLRFSFIVAKRNSRSDFSRIDLWYTRGKPEKHNEFLLYPVSLKSLGP